MQASGKAKKVWVAKVVDGKTGRVVWELPEDSDSGGR